MVPDVSFRHQFLKGATGDSHQLSDVNFRARTGARRQFLVFAGSWIGGLNSWCGITYGW